MAKSRKDSKGRVLRSGESETIKNGKSYYTYRYKDTAGDRASVSAPTLPELREKEKALQEDFFKGLSTGREREKTVAEMCDIYLETKVNLKATTLNNYKYMVDHFIRGQKIGKMKITQVKKSDIQKYYADLLKNGLPKDKKPSNGKYREQMKPATIENIQTILHPVFQRAIDDGYIYRNPTQNIIPELKNSDLWDKNKREALTPQQQEAFFDYIRNNPVYAHWTPLFTFMFGTGCRVGEVIGATWDDVNTKEGIFTISHNLVYHRVYDKDYKMAWFMNTPKTKGSQREIPLMSDVRSMLIRLKKEYFANPLPPIEIEGKEYNIIFRNRFGSNYIPSEINRAIKRIVRDYNRQEEEKAAKEGREPLLLPPFSCHVIRHTTGTRIWENTGDLNLTKDFLGHSDISTTANIYVDVQREKRKEAIKEIEKNIKIS